MDYKYIEQLLERYWNCETSLEEEDILRTFFSQKDIPAHLLPYQALFVYEQKEVSTHVLGSDFDSKILSVINEEEPLKVKARTITMTQRLMPLFKAAAVVAIFLTLGNAAQESFNSSKNNAVNIAGYNKIDKGASVAMSDSTTTDTLQKATLQPIPVNIIK